jgi:hypothetical protein
MLFYESFEKMQYHIPDYYQPLHPYEQLNARRRENVAMLIIDHTVQHKKKTMCQVDHSATICITSEPTVRTASRENCASDNQKRKTSIFIYVIELLVLVMLVHTITLKHGRIDQVISIFSFVTLINVQNDPHPVQYAQMCAPQCRLTRMWGLPEVAVSV